MKKKDKVSDYQDQLPIGAWGYYKKLNTGLNDGRTFAEILAEIKAEADLDQTKRDLLSEAILLIVKRIPNKKP